MSTTNALLASISEQGNVLFGSYLSYLSLFKFLGVVLTGFFVGAGIFLTIKTGYYTLTYERFRATYLKTERSKRHTVRAWKQIQRHRFAGDENNLKIAIIEADKVLDEALRLLGYAGDTISDRLKNIPTDELPNIDEVWMAHKLRNQLVHETSFVLSRDTGERALSIYEEAFRNLGVLT